LKSNAGNRGVRGVFFLLSIAGVPALVALLVNFPTLFLTCRRLTFEMLWSVIGFSVFLPFYFLAGAPVRSYILEHELSHVLFAVFSGVRVRGVSFKKERAYVKTQKINILIALAPYSFPLYTFILVLIYRVIVIFYTNRLLTALFYFLSGISLSFHIVATLHYLQLDQPDVKRYGYVPSLMIIFTWSLILLSLLFALMFREVELAVYYRNVLHDVRVLYGHIPRIVHRLITYMTGHWHF